MNYPGSLYAGWYASRGILGGLARIAVDSSDIDEALLALLESDATLKSYLPDGIYWDEAAVGAKRFVLVSLLAPHDIAGFGGRVNSGG